MSFRVTLMGTGTSMGVPQIGCRCEVCTSKNPKNQRLRTGVLIENAETTLLIDLPPDLRQQALQYKLDRLHGVLLTHHHADHLLGLDDLRRFNALMRTRINIYTLENSIESVKKAFHYVFHPQTEYESFLPQLTLQALDGPITIGSLPVIPIPLMHNRLPVLGFRLGNFAFLTDCNQVPESSRPLLKDLKYLVLGALRHKPHPAHYTVEEAVEEACRIGAQQTYLTHIAHDLEHDATNAALPAGIAMAWDGLTLDCK
jgi:phosphoribosyl 1,2-cyclic phosphate phosphodiesterase